MRASHHPITRTITALGVVALLAACGGDAPEPTTVEGGGMAMCVAEAPDCVDTVVSEDPGLVDPPQGDEPVDTFVGPEIDIVDEIADGTIAVEMAPQAPEREFPVFVQWAAVDGPTVTAVFSGGETPCFVISRVTAEEREDAVVLTVLAADPSDEQTCESAVSTQSVTVELEADLGQRTLLDGSRVVPDGATS